MPKIILVRHGQTDYNLQRRYQGSVDIPLNATGISQAEALRPRLAKIKLDAAYCSDLTRTRQTAALILEKHPSGLAAKPTPLIREISGGLFEGLTYEQMQSQFPEDLPKWEADRYNYRAPQGENLQAVEIRLREFLDIVAKEQIGENRNVLVVAHGGIVSTLMCLLMQMKLNNLWQWRVDTCSLTVADLYPEGAILSLFNDTAHLNPGLPGERI